MTVLELPATRIATDGTRHHGRVWAPASARAGVVVVHGLTDHGGRYDGPGRALAEHGIAVLAMDLRGHGRSAGPRGHTPSFDRLIHDVIDSREELRGRIGPVPVFVLGHSMGGLITIRCVEEFPRVFDGAIVISPWLGTTMRVPRWKLALAGVLSRLVPALPIPARIDAAALSHDAAVVRAYREDPLVHDRITPRLFTEAQAAMRLCWQHAERIQLPVLFLIAGDDRIVDAGLALEFAESLPSDRTTVRVYDGGFHELLNEPDAERIRDDLREWLEARITGAVAAGGAENRAG